MSGAIIADESPAYRTGASAAETAALNTRPAVWLPGAGLDAERAVVQPVAVRPVARGALLIERPSGRLRLVPVAGGDRGVDGFGVFPGVRGPLRRVGLALGFPERLGLREGLFQHGGVFLHERHVL